MVYRICIAILFAAVLSSCGNTPTALEYNAKIVAISDSMRVKGTRWALEFNEDVKTKDFSKLMPLRKDIENFVADKTTEMSGYKDVQGSAGLSKAMLDFLACEKQLMQQGFMPFEKLGGTSTDSDVKAAIDNIKQEAVTEQALLDKLREEEQAYAKKNNITLKPVTY